MAAMSQAREITSTIERALPQGLYRVSLQGGASVTAALSAQARRTTVRVVAGDRVVVEVSAIDPSRGRITLCSGEVAS